MKRKIWIIVLALISIASMASSTMAYFTGEDRAHNVITTGGVHVALVEQQRTGDTYTPFPKEGVTGVLPGTSISKIVSVENTGSAPAWVRIRLTASIENAQGEALPPVLEDGTSVMSMELLPGWVVGPDGWLYYREPVAVDGATTPAFEAVHMAAEMGNVYQESTCDLVVEAQAVQSDNNPLTGELWEIPGWPEEGA